MIGGILRQLLAYRRGAWYGYAATSGKEFAYLPHLRSFYSGGLGGVRGDVSGGHRFTKPEVLMNLVQRESIPQNM